MSELATTHASAILLGECGVLVRGPSGSGKSSLAYTLLAEDRTGARLVADDRVILIAANGRLLADVPTALAGMIELRGIGILGWPHLAPVLVRLVVDLEPPESCPRLPEEDESRTTVNGIALPRLCLPVGGNDGPARIRAAIRHILG
jgi:HPr kinase/phosphorylase